MLSTSHCASRAAALGAMIFLVQSNCLANHGPGASGGGSQTFSGETLKQGHMELSLRADYTQFQHFDQSAAAARAQAAGDFDALHRGYLSTLGFSYGLTDDLELAASIGYFHGEGFIGAEFEDGDTAIGTANPTGLTDLTLLAKYRVLQGAPGNLAFIAGVILPTGKSHVHLSNGEHIHPTDQPGTGRFGLPVGIAYSRFLTSHLTIDASAMYTVRFEKDSFKVGDRIDVGIALAYRITESIQTFPQFSVFAELNDVYLFPDRHDGEDDENSGGNTLYLNPGFRVRFNQNVALTVAPSFPLCQHLNGDQGRVEFKLNATLAFSF